MSSWHKNTDTEILSLPTVDWMIVSGFASIIGSFNVSALLRALPEGKVSSPLDTLHSLADPDHRVPLRTSLVSTLMAGISTASGASVGLYGPLIHFRSFVADAMRRLIGTAHISWQTLVSCGVATAILLVPLLAPLLQQRLLFSR